MNREYALRTAWHVCQVKGLRPSRRLMQAEMKYLTGTKTSSEIIEVFLKKYQVESDDGNLKLLTQEQIGTNRHKSAQNALKPCSIGTTSAQTGSTCADLTVTVQEVETTSLPEPLAQAEDFIKAIDTLIAPPRVSLPERSEDVTPLTCAAPPKESAIRREEDLKVGALLDLLAPHVQTILVAMNASDWRKRNMDAARSLVNAGMKPHEVLSAWQRLKSHDGAQYFMLARLQIAMQQDAQPKSKPQNKFRSEIDDKWERKSREAWAKVGGQVV